MKTKYVVLRESSYDVTNGHSSYSKVKSFRNEPEAMAFITDPKNLRLYGELFLELYSYDGSRYEWDSSKQEWVLR